MANRPAPALVLRDGDRKELESWLRSRSVSAGLAKRARIVLMVADGAANRQIAHVVGGSPTTVIEWRSRYLERGLKGLDDLDRSGRPRDLDHPEIVTAILLPTADEARIDALVDPAAG